MTVRGAAPPFPVLLLPGFFLMFFLLFFLAPVLPPWEVGARAQAGMHEMPESPPAGILKRKKPEKPEKQGILSGPDPEAERKWLEFGLVSGDPSFLFWIGTTALRASEGAATRKERVGYLTVARKAFRRILAIAPGEVRPRLELARTLFLLGEDRAARRQFEKVLAGSLPPAVKRNVETHLSLIRGRRRWSAAVGVALSPDSNIGASDTGDSLEVGPLRFRLDDPDRPESGTGLQAWGNWRHHRPLRPGLNWRSGADASALDWPGRGFDRQHVSAQSGPQWLWERRSLGLSLEAGLSRQGDRTHSEEYGVRADGTVRLSPRLWLHPHGRVVERSHRLDGARDGPRWSAGLRATFRATPRLTLHGALRHDRERPERRDHRSRRWGLDAGFGHDLPGGFTVGLDASVARTVYGPDWGFLTRGEPERRDRLRSVRLWAHHRGWSVKGFSPRVSVHHERRRSNAQLQDYERLRGEITFVRRF